MAACRIEATAGNSENRAAGGETAVNISKRVLALACRLLTFAYFVSKIVNFRA